MLDAPITCPLRVQAAMGCARWQIGLSARGLQAWPCYTVNFKVQSEGLQNNAGLHRGMDEGSIPMSLCCPWCMEVVSGLEGGCCLVAALGTQRIVAAATHTMDGVRGHCFLRGLCSQLPSFLVVVLQHVPDAFGLSRHACTGLRTLMLWGPRGSFARPLQAAPVTHEAAAADSRCIWGPKSVT